MTDEELIQHVVGGRVEIVKADATNITAAHKAAALDKHGTIGITDVVLKNKEVIGHVSLAGVPMVLVWLDTQKVKGRDSLYVMNFLENMAQRCGWKTICVPCVKNSPILPYLEKVGYKKEPQDVSLFIKEL